VETKINKLKIKENTIFNLNNFKMVEGMGLKIIALRSP
jgi:hypothetical protein